MTNTLPSKNGAAPKRSGRESAVGLQRHKRSATDIGLALITPLVGQEFLDKYNPVSYTHLTLPTTPYV